MAKTILRWIVVVPLVLLAGMSGSLLGGIALSVFGNQVAIDAGSAFWGCFALVFAAGLIAPTKRDKTTLVFAGLIALLAIISLVLSVATSLEGVADRSPLQKILIPVCQILGGLYAAFLLPPPGTSLDLRWQLINVLGMVVICFGIVISLGGFVVRVFAGSWAGVATGLGVIALGAATWLFPFAHVLLRMMILEAALKNNLMSQRNNSSPKETSSEEDRRRDAFKLECMKEEEAKAERAKCVEQRRRLIGTRRVL